ncbi:LacI family DNA-binding transcriptional regulator [Streptomyces sp. MP131-18]|uniref:LacI family DNA-binding transcriptional regulator n=1 Tax=Streptomyces sp. MP131-18 TaxID=1857892 RepID=UPI00097C1BA2|nr:LacI family DNA-binding transcriptional regulator [Streptomyces sp. MP131-18]ONK09388.1 Purine nucleotide synthesis repressor [Streptomyces sp. MP131-18]
MVRATGSGGPTLAVVAREAGVSVPTASKVANGRQDVAPETRRRVTEVLDRLGYVRRQRPPAHRRPDLVDLVVHDLAGPRAGAVLHGVDQAAHEAGLGVVISAALTGARGDGPGRGWLERLSARGPADGPAGVLLHVKELDAAQHAWLEQRHIPCVMIDPVADPPADIPSVGATNWQGGVSATEHLIGLGHRRIAVIGGARHRTCGAGRVAGHRSAMSAAGLQVPPEYVRYGSFDEAGAGRQMLDLLALPEPPTAVFACSDAMALGAVRALGERGLRVPRDVSVVGFDDLPQAVWATPALTTVRQPLSEMAAAALRLLLRLLDGDRPEGMRTELSTRLVVRDSTAPPAA